MNINNPKQKRVQPVALQRCAWSNAAACLHCACGRIHDLTSVAQDSTAQHSTARTLDKRPISVSKEV
jgi:hypothetical protein